MEKTLEASLDLSIVPKLYSWVGVREVTHTKFAKGRTIKGQSIRLGKVREIVDAEKCLCEVIYYTEYGPGLYDGSLMKEDLERVYNIFMEDMVVLKNPMYQYSTKVRKIGYQFAENILELIESHFN